LCDHPGVLLRSEAAGGHVAGERGQAETFSSNSARGGRGAMGGKYIAPDWFFLIFILLCSLWWLQVMLAVDDSRSMAENVGG
jgi:hypothetical protein